MVSLALRITENHNLPGRSSSLSPTNRHRHHEDYQCGRVHRRPKTVPGFSQERRPAPVRPRLVLRLIQRFLANPQLRLEIVDLHFEAIRVGLVLHALPFKRINLVRWRPFSESQRDTITLWTLLSKTRTFLAELLCFAEREWRSKRYSTTSKAGKRSKTFWRDFLPSRVNRQLLRSKKRNTCCSHAPKCAF